MKNALARQEAITDTIYLWVPRWSFLAWYCFDHWLVLFKHIPHALCKPIHSLKSYAQKANSQSLVASMTTRSENMLKRLQSIFHTPPECAHGEQIPLCRVRVFPGEHVPECSMGGLFVALILLPSPTIRLPCGLAPPPL